MALEVLLRSTKAVRLAPAFNPPVEAMGFRVPMDLCRWWRDCLMGAIFSVPKAMDGTPRRGR